MKLISICPSNTELCAYLGIEDQLIAIDDYSDWPESVQSLPKVGPDLSINMDAVEALQPDLVIASLSVPGMEKNIEALKVRGIPHIVLNPQSLEDIAGDLIILGEAVGQRQKGEQCADHFRSVIMSYQTIADTVKEKPSLYWEWWPNPLFSPGGVNWLSEISRLAGARNILEDIDLASIQIDQNDIRKRNPDHICLAWVGVPLSKIKPDLILKRPHWNEIKAVKEGNIHIMEEPLYCRPSPRLLKGLEKLAALLHPDAFHTVKRMTF
ncbi:cobalamin-binding protein [Bacillus massiliglaciei]|uniref:cobalamin-binding protein n=1 Tax=Bacillus massiliglaciei TaxID=1816693 RepID=UPI000AC2E2A0|nr:cobalamin-binding protein [Bacillus massiliglaciei]